MNITLKFILNNKDLNLFKMNFKIIYIFCDKIYKIFVCMSKISVLNCILILEKVLKINIVINFVQ